MSDERGRELAENMAVKVLMGDMETPGPGITTVKMRGGSVSEAGGEPLPYVVVVAWGHEAEALKELVLAHRQTDVWLKG